MADFMGIGCEGMDISGQGVQGTVQGPGTNHYVESSESYTVKAPAAADGKSALLNSLEPGSYIYGQVQSTSEDGAVLLLENGQKLLAKLTEGVNLVPGQNVTFQVEKKQDGMVYMKPLFAEAALEMTAAKILKGAGFMNTLKNLEIVKELLEHNMPVDRNTIRSMLQKSVSNPDVPIKQLALLEKLGIPVTKENIEQLKQYQANEHQLGKQMDSLIKELGAETDRLLMEGKTEDAVRLNQKVLDFLYEELTTQGQETESTAAQTGGTKGDEAAAGLKNLTGGILGEENSLPEGLLGEGKETAEEVPGDGKSPVAETVQGGGKGMSAVFAAENGEISGRERMTDGIIEGRGERTEGTAENGNVLKQAGVSHKPDEPAGNLQEAAGKIQAGETSEGSSSNIKEQMFELKNLLAHTTQPEELKKLLGSAKFQGILEKGMKEAWQMKPSEFNGKDSVNRTYARVEEQARLLGELLKESGAQGGNSLKTVSNVQQNLEFMQDLNQVFPYLQLPLQMAGESAHGDLYVFKDKKKQHEAGEPFTAFLHLSMEHLGDVDVYLSLKEQQVSTDITLEQEDVLDLFEAHIDELTSRLEKKGYQVSTKLQIGSREPDFVEDILAKQAGGNLANRYSFDVKA